MQQCCSFNCLPLDNLPLPVPMSTRLLLGLLLDSPNLVLEKFKLLLFQMVSVAMLWQALRLCVTCSDSVFYSYIKPFFIYAV